MKRDGFAAILVLAIVLALAVAGGIAWVHYVYLPGANKSASGSTSVTSTAALVPTSTAPTTTKAPTSTAVSQKSSSESCATGDLNCLIAAAEHCTPAAVEWTAPVNLGILGFIETTQSHLAIAGTVSGGDCSFSDRTDDISLSLNPQEEQYVKSQGATDAQMQEQLQKETAQVKQQSVGVTISCKLPASYLAKILTNWSEGKFSSLDLTSEYCTATDANGQAMNLASATGSIPLTPAPVASGTVMLQPLSDVAQGSLEFRASSVYSYQLTMTVTNHATGQSGTVTLKLGQPTTVIGYTMTATHFQVVQGTDAQGHPTFDNEATVVYQHQ